MAAVRDDCQVTNSKPDLVCRNNVSQVYHNPIGIAQMAAAEPCDRINPPACPEIPDSDLFEINGCDPWENPNWVNMLQEGDAELIKFSTCSPSPHSIVEELFQETISWGNKPVVAQYENVQNGGIVVNIKTLPDDYWESLPPYVSICNNPTSMVEFSKMFNCTVPVAIVQVGPGCFLPVLPCCIEGVCYCQYVLCGAQCQLKPCRFAAAVLGFDRDVSVDDVYVLTSVCRGARIVDKDCPSAYKCDNYSSILHPKVIGEMTDNVKAERSQDKIRLVHTPPRCVHALGAIEKSDGKLRPITDCSQPDSVNINMFMDTAREKFHYKSVERWWSCCPGASGERSVTFQVPTEACTFCQAIANSRASSGTVGKVHNITRT